MVEATAVAGMEVPAAGMEAMAALEVPAAVIYVAVREDAASDAREV